MANSDDSEPLRKRTKCSKKFVRFNLPNQSPDNSAVVVDDEEVANSAPTHSTSAPAPTADDQAGPSTSSPPDIEIIFSSASVKSVEEDDKQPQSLLLSKLGQGDILVKIFDYITSPTEKVRLERVCRAFRRLAPTAEAWTSVWGVFVEDVENDPDRPLLMNGDQMSAWKIPYAIESLLARIPIVYTIDVGRCTLDIVYHSLMASLLRIGVKSKSLKNVEEIYLNGRSSDDYIAPLISAFSCSLRFVDVMAVRFANAVTAGHFWQAVGECTELNGFRIETDTQDWDEHSSPEMVMQALAGKHISTIGLMGLGRITSDHVISILDALPADEFVRCLEIDSESFSLVDFELRVAKKHWENIYELKYVHNGYLAPIDPTWSIMRRIPRMCPNLKALSLFKAGAGGSKMLHPLAFELIDEYLTVLDDLDIQEHMELELDMTETEAQLLFGALITQRKCREIYFAEGSRFTGFHPVIRRSDKASILLAFD